LYPAGILQSQIDKYTYTFDAVAFTKALVAANYRPWRLILIGGPDDLEPERVIWALREEDVRRYAEGGEGAIGERGAGVERPGAIR